MSKTIYHTGIIYELNERLFNNALEGVTEEQANERVSGHNNPIIWIAAHTVDTRYSILTFLGKPAVSPYRNMFENYRAYDPSINYPTLEQTKKEWSKVSRMLNEAIQSVSDEQLNAESEFKSPIGVNTNAGTIAFFAHHESYDIGQIAFLKKYFTKEAMSY